MKHPKQFPHFYTFSNLVILLATKVGAQSSTNFPEAGGAFIPKCINFIDNRPTLSSHVTAYDSEKQPIILTLPAEESSINLKCDTENAEQHSISWEHEKIIPLLGRRNFYVVSNGSSPRHQHSYFTATGHYYDKMTGNYYKPDGDYCVKSISNEGIDLQVCVANSDCSITSTPNTYCLPKCCALDETMLPWERQCVRLPETHGRTPWTPSIYEGPQNSHKVVPSNPNIIYHMAQLPQKCHVVNAQSEHNNETSRDDYWWSSAAYVKNQTPDQDPLQKDHVKLVLPTNGHKKGKIQYMSLYHDSRKWKLANYDNFCVEGFYDESKDGPEYTGNPDKFMIFYCPNEENGRQNYGEGIMSPKWKSWTYAVVCLLAVLFLLATVLIYLLLWDKHNLHGLTILGYSISTFWGYLFFTVAHFVSLYPNLNMNGFSSRNPFCYGNAVLAHYFYFSSYIWLSVMNFDLWDTFKSMRVRSKDDKEWSKFGAYSIVAWVFPALLIMAFVIVNEVYRDAATEVPVPDYAVGNCFVSPDFRGEYVYAPMGIILVINIVLIGMTMGIFIQARRRSTSTFNAGSAANAKKYNAKLFGKLFLVMGGSSIVNFLTWYYNNKGYKPWLIVALEDISYFSPIVLFILFCLNDKIIGQLKEKFSRFTETVPKVVKKEGGFGPGDSNVRQQNVYGMTTLNGTRYYIPPENTRHE